MRTILAKHDAIAMAGTYTRNTSPLLLLTLPTESYYSFYICINPTQLVLFHSNIFNDLLFYFKI